MLLLACIGAPLLAHVLGSRCWIYLPAHVPILLVGLAFGLRAGGVAGVLSAVIELGCGMMGFVPTLPIAIELVTYGVVAGAVGARARTWPSLVGALVCAMIAGRIAHLVLALAVRGTDVRSELHALFVDPRPGIVLQLVALPVLALLCRRTRP